MSSITDLLTTTSRSTGKVLYEESELLSILAKAGCQTKTDMIMCLIDMGHNQSSVAVTLLKYGVLNEKSHRQHVRNTVERKLTSRLTR